ncbi:uncharacterized protein LOC34624292 [Cyclospora cayetanensis]|uniref:Uncharacterized protein LOC34624292 n=1 Tax=Cyclospora cayetanensis TaxID=88456 RepID=A0A6P6RWZ3_9EIME|nr:uncharacterized protein LOC34624292 [Cyclospora cayetanensis]
MGRSAGQAKWLTSCRRFMTDHPKSLVLRVRFLLLLDCTFIALAITSLSAPWYMQEWRVANGEILAWTLNLGTAKFRVDCSSDSPEFLDLCKNLYGRLAGDLRAVTRSICNAGEKVRDTELQAYLGDTCSDMRLIEKLSVSTGAGGGICICMMAFGIVCFLLHVWSGFRNRRAWRADLFHFQPPLNVAFDPAEAEPISHELLYGFITAITSAALLIIYLPFWWKAAPFDPDPYFVKNFVI